MKVSRGAGLKQGKAVIIASSKEVGQAIERRMMRRGIGLQSKVENLGVDFTAGGKKKKGKAGRHASKGKKGHRGGSRGH